jgi:flavin reductase (DIM6/NTAB) family NADH-FMN oxidoreductase RutF
VQGNYRNRLQHAVMLVTSRTKKGGPKAAPLPSWPRTGHTPQLITAGFRRSSTPLKPSRRPTLNCPAALQRAGCINDDLLH